MDRNAVVDRLKGNRPQLEALGLRAISVFGSTARDQQQPGSDIDLAVTLDRSAKIDLFRFAALNTHLSRLLGEPVDVVVEPARNRRVQAHIDRDRLRVF